MASSKKREWIEVKGARTHNLQNIDVKIPRGEFVVISGVSGSGKSSLAFDTLYAEGQRRYVESLSSYARQFIGQIKKADCDGIEGLSPAISIDQKQGSHNHDLLLPPLQKSWITYVCCGRGGCSPLSGLWNRSGTANRARNS